MPIWVAGTSVSKSDLTESIPNTRYRSTIVQMRITRSEIQSLRSHRGFTLIEIMVVIAIIALASASVVFGFNAVISQRLKSEVEKASYWFEAVSETAVFQASVLGIRSTEEGFDVVAFYDNRWYPFRDIEVFQLSGEFQLEIETEDLIDFGAEIDNREQDREPFVAFLPSGQAIPAGRMSFFNDDEPPAAISWDNNAEFDFVFGDEDL